MPRVAKTLGLAVLLAWPGWLVGQTLGPSAPTPDWPEGVLQSSLPAVGGSRDSAVGPMRLETAQLPQDESAADANPVRQLSPEISPAAGVALSPRDNPEPLPLSSPGSSGRAADDRGGGLSAALTVAGSLGIVLGIFLLVAWGMRRATPAGATLLPGEVFEVLGRAPVGGRQQVQLLRWGNKLLLVSVTPAGAETLAEITDSAEVDRLAGLCRQAHPGSATAAFRQVLAQFGAARPDDVTTNPAASDRLERTDV